MSWYIVVVLLCVLCGVRAKNCRGEEARERACENLCDETGNCTVRAALLLPRNTSYDASLSMVESTLELALQQEAIKQAFPEWVQFEWMSYDVQDCDAAYAVIGAIDAYNDCAHVFFGPSCDFALASVARIAKFLGSTGTPMLTTGGFSFDFVEPKQNCSAEFYMLVRAGPVGFKDLAFFLIDIMRHFEWKKLLLITEPEAQVNVAGKSSCLLMMKSLANYLKKEEIIYTPWDTTSDAGLNYTENLKIYLKYTYTKPREDNTVPPAEPDGEAQPETTLELDPSILNILGDEPPKEEILGKAIHKDIACRWSDILINGLKEDIWKEMVKSHDIPENLTLAQSPLLNPEIKAAVNENAIKRDAILSEKQRLLACAITCIADLMSSTLDKSTDQMKTLKTLSDTGRLLCHVHHSETAARRKFLLACLSKDVKDNIKDLKRDRQLFGTDLSEKLKSMKAITKTGVEMRPTSTKAKSQPKGKLSEASTSRALNWRGPPPPAPRRGYTRPNSTTGGRSRQPAATAAAARGSRRRDPKVRSKVTRR